jgi:hypothetical protein
MLVLQYPIGIDRKRVWNRIDRKQARERSLKAPIAILQPRRCPGSRLAPPAADLNLLRESADRRQRLPARSAPRRPEVDQHHLALHIVERYPLAIFGGHRKRRSHPRPRQFWSLRIALGPLSSAAKTLTRLNNNKRFISPPPANVTYHEESVEKRDYLPRGLIAAGDCCPFPVCESFKV